MSDLLAAVVRATAATPHVDGLLDRAAHLLVDHRADWVVADRLEDPDLILRVAGYDRDGRLAVSRRAGTRPARRSTARTLGVLPEVLRAPRHMLRLDKSRLEELAARSGSHSARQASEALALGTTELLVVGLVRRNEPLGVLTLGLRHGSFTDEELTDLSDVAVHLAVAMYAARLHASQSSVATALQHSLLPPLPVVDGIRLAARYVPAARGAEVGGDWYDVFGDSQRLTAVIGDTVGHDLMAAARMAELRNILRALATDRQEPPAALLERLDRTAVGLGVDDVIASCIAGRLVS
ncbi:MAG TPA: SpoIIE family protein phosphatase [Mycobacteriales bacterium]|nr:SpoIIE family protein phosphatase [Mycobacteriales bacterium]